MHAFGSEIHVPALTGLCMMSSPVAQLKDMFGDEVLNEAEDMDVLEEPSEDEKGQEHQWSQLFTELNSDLSTLYMLT